MDSDNEGIGVIVCRAGWWSTGRTRQWARVIQGVKANMERLTKRHLLSELANSLDSSLAKEVVERYRKRFDISDVEKLLLLKIREEISDEAQDNQD